MNKELEQKQKIRIINPCHNLRSIGEQNGIHCLQEQSTVGEPISSVDFRLYQMALVEGGSLPPQDAKNKVKQLKEKYDSGSYLEKERIADVIGHAFQGLTERRVFAREPINVASEHIIYLKN